VKEILVNAHSNAEQIMTFCRDASSAECRLNCSFEPTLLETGGALRRAAWFLEKENSFWLLNADIVADLDPRPLQVALSKPGRIAALWMLPDRGPRTVDCVRGKVANFRSATPGQPGTATFSGLHLLRPEILQYLPEAETACSIITAYDKAMKAGRHVAAVSVASSFWADVGTPEQYLEAHPAWRVHLGKRAASFQKIHPSARIDQGARVSNSIVFEDAVIRRHVRVDGAIVAPGTDVGQSGTRLLAPVPQVASVEEQDALNRQDLGSDACCAECLSPRGSARQFIRVSRGRHSVMLVRYDPSRKENPLYGNQARKLRGVGLPVFKVLEEGRTEHFLRLEDLGRITLLDKMQSATPSLRMAWYQRAVSLMHEFHERTAQLKRGGHLPLMPPFTARMYGIEHELFIQEFLPLTSDPAAVRHLLPELRAAARRLTRLPRVIVHRDYQSTNLMVHQRKLWLIDFQGMRKGPALHDLASLLLDPYMKLSEEDVDRLLATYRGLLPDGAFREKDFHVAAVQRLIQALGAFGRLSKLPGCGHFLQHIPAALEGLERSAKYSKQMPKLADWARRVRASESTSFVPR
jgi:aminoglycoside/choline kinase family phosphotransferase/dTDP-glucose pyrophosphorylase